MIKKSKFWYLVLFSLKKRIMTKAFVIANVLIAILIIGLANITNIIEAFGGEFDDAKTYLVYDETDATYATLNSLLEDDSLIQFELATDSFDSEDLDFEEYDGSIRIYTDTVLKSEVYIENISLTNEATLTTLLATAKTAVWQDGLSPEALAEFESFPDMTTAINNVTDDVTDSENTILSVLGTFILVPIFIMLVMLMQFIGMDILEEKSSKSIEYIISNVEPVKHFGSKIVSSVLFLIIQSLIFLVAGVIGAFIATSVGGSIMDSITSSDIPATDLASVRELIANLPMIILVLVLFIVFGFTFYLVMVAVFAAMATSMEDYQQFITPVMLLVVATFYFAMFGSIFSGANILKIAGYIPIFAPMITPLLYISGEYTIIETLISLGILVIFDAFVIYFGSPLYKVSILDYSQDKFFKKIMKIIRKAKYAE